MYSGTIFNLMVSFSFHGFCFIFEQTLTFDSTWMSMRVPSSFAFEIRFRFGFNIPFFDFWSFTNIGVYLHALCQCFRNSRLIQNFLSCYPHRVSAYCFRSTSPIKCWVVVCWAMGVFRRRFAF